MLLLRLVGILLAIGILGCVAAWLLTGRNAYRRLAWKLARFGLIVVLVFVGLLFVERALTPIL